MRVTYCQMIHGQPKRIDYTPVSADESNFIRKLSLSACGHSFFISCPYEVLTLDANLQYTVYKVAARFVLNIRKQLC